MKSPSVLTSLIVAAIGLTSCSGGSPAPATPSALQMNRAYDAPAVKCPCIYAANFYGSTVTVYPTWANGNAKPRQAFSGGMDAPLGIAVDARARTYVANLSDNSVSVYAAGSNGPVSPVQVIAGSKTGLNVPTSIAVDSVNGDIYVANGNQSITFYEPHANGNVRPLGKIKGANTQLQYPAGIALDAAGNVYVTTSSSILVFAAGAKGNVAPIRAISGSNTGLEDPLGIALDAGTNIYVVNSGGLNVLVFASGSDGNVSPIRNITGKETQLRQGPSGIAVDANGVTYVSTYSAGHGSSIKAYGADANGDVPPVTVIKGKRTQLDAPFGIAVR